MVFHTKTLVFYDEPLLLHGFGFLRRTPFTNDPFCGNNPKFLQFYSIFDNFPSDSCPAIATTSATTPPTSSRISTRRHRSMSVRCSVARCLWTGTLSDSQQRRSTSQCVHRQQLLPAKAAESPMESSTSPTRSSTTASASSAFSCHCATSTIWRRASTTHNATSCAPSCA